MIRDYTDDEARAAMVLKWGTTPEGVIPAWVAEMDYALADVVADALADAVRRQVTGYPVFAPGGALGEAYAGFAGRRFGQSDVDPRLLMPVSDVTAGVRVALDVLSPPGPLILPVPAYNPQFGVPATCAREVVYVHSSPDAPDAGLNLAGIDAALRDAAGVGRGGTVLLTQPHNPTGQVYTRAELTELAEIVNRHGGRVISDEIHAPLVLPGAEHVPYLSVSGTAKHAIAVVAASKAFNTAGLRCAQMIATDQETFRTLTDVPMPRNDSWSPLGVVAAIAAYRDGDEWLDALIARFDQLRTLLGELLGEHLPKAKMRPLQATYLAWLDLREYGHDRPDQVVLRGGVRVGPGHIYDPTSTGHIRLNIATSPERLTEIVRRLGAALS